MPAPLRMTGLVAAPHTPLTASGELNLPMVSQQVDLLIESGVSGAFIGGTTGECHSLSVAERQALATTWQTAVGGRMPVIVHVGHNSLPDAQALAAHAAQTGAAAIAAAAPCYFKPGAVEELVEFCAAVASVAPNLPFYYYEIPIFTGVRLSTSEFLSRGGERIPSLAGLKFTHNDFEELAACTALEKGRFEVFFGFDEMLLGGLAYGLKAAVGATYNFAAPLYLRLMNAVRTGDLAAARVEQLRAIEMIRVLKQFGFARASKAVMSFLGVDCGPVRSPLKPMTREETQQLFSALQPLNCFARPLRKP